ncbi:DUF2474 family protein [Methylobacterium sp. SI9]
MVTASPFPLWKRLAWFVAIWAFSIAALGSVATLLRFWLKS